MTILIKDKDTKQVIHSSEKETFPEAVSEAIQLDKSLINANLRGKDISGVDFSGVDLSGASLVCAIARDCNFNDTNFSGADISAADMLGSTMKLAKVMGAKTRFTTLPIGSCIVHVGGGLPFFFCGETVEVFGYEPKPYTYWMEMGYNEAIEVGGKNLADKLEQLQRVLLSFILS